ncbi:hypothetical protein [Streptomyces sp. MAR4 CNX-425]|uniref:hypothetical protein n=1 Tax=Streptomyces sp. MAR4 CNX-425 TaxID=3406343 RepID=UPI003B506A51
MTHDGHGSEEHAGAVPPASDGAGTPPGGEPWWAQDPSPAAAAAEPAEDESTQQIRHLGNRPEHPRPPGHAPQYPPPAPQAGGPAGPQPWPLPATPESAAAAPPPYGGPPQQPPAGPPPGPADDGASTQLIPPVGAAPQHRPGGDADATEMIPSFPGPYENPPPGAPPAQNPGQPPFAPPAYDHEEDSPRSARHAVPVHEQFEGLFRDAAPAGDPGATQKLPPVRPEGAPAPGARPGGPPPGPYAQPQPHAQPQPYAQAQAHGHGPGAPPPGRYYDGDDDRRGSIPRWAAIAIGTAACAAVGITAGWLLSSGDGGGETASGATPSASAEPDPGGKGDGDGDGDGEKPVKDDRAQEQAEELDALLDESNDSREAVISSVQNIRECKALGKAAKDLRDAAGQRRDLVNRLSDLSVDQLPSHGQLTRSLTDAWNASASADDHYAKWADASKRGKRCRGGGAHLSAGNRASGEATAAKEQAAGLWNPIADEYGLSRRQATQL